MDAEGISLGGDNTEVSATPPPVGQDGSVDEGLASPFLNEVSPDHRAIVAPYIKKWDAGVTKKFQEYSSKLKPYESLGHPVEELQKFVNLGRHIQTNPENVFKIMWDGLQQQYGENFQAELFRILQLEAEEEMSNEAESGYFQEESDPNEQFQQNVAAELEELRAWREETVAAQQSAAENQQLDYVLHAMHNKFGDFDDNWILTRLAEHGNVDQAVKEWQMMLGRYSQSNGAQRQAPKVMGGQGGVPSGQVDTKALRGKDRRQIVEAMLEQAG